MSPSWEQMLLAVAAGLSAAPDVAGVVDALSRLADPTAVTGSAELLLTEVSRRPRHLNNEASLQLPLPVGLELPLVAGGMVLGSLVLRWDRPSAMTASERAALVLLAACTADALRRCQVESAGRALARSLHDAVRPALPSAGHLDLAGRYLPAGPASLLGGDWFDAFIASDGTATVVIGDVTGHGTDAAGEMTQLRGLLANAAATTEQLPSEALRELDRALDRLSLPAGATALVMRIEQDAGLRRRGIYRVRWSNAGHPAPLVRLPDGRVIELAPSPELCLGVDVTACRSDHVREVPVGSTLLLFTDGLVESRRRDMTAGTGLLRAALATWEEPQLDGLLDHVVSQLDDASNDDDVAVLAVRLGADQ
jgi:serine phosphatase RsbU (regulator of sigma subunit)